MPRTIYNKLAFAIALFLLAWATLAYGAVHQPVIATVYLGIAGLIVLWFLDGFRSGFRCSRHPLQLPIYLLSFYGLIQTVAFSGFENVGGIEGIRGSISLDPFATKVTALHVLALGTYFSILLVLLDRESRLRRFAVFLAIFGFAYAFFAILQSVLSPGRIFGFYESIFAEPFGSFVSRNNYAAWICLAMALPLGLLLSGGLRRDKLLLYITAITLMAVSLLLSGSRGGLVAFSAEVVVLLLIAQSRSEKSHVFVKFGLAGLLIVLVAAGTIFVGGETSLTRIANERGVTDTTADRSHIWSVTAKIIADSFPWGVGLGAYPQAYSKFDANSGTARVEQAHNDYLQIVADAGLPGVILGIWFLGLLLKTSRKAITESRSGFRRGVVAGSIAGITGCLIHSIFDFVLHTTAIAMLFLSLLAILVASVETPDESTSSMKLRVRKRRSRIAAGPLRKPLGV